MASLGDAALYDLWLTERDGEAFAELARRHAPVVFDIAARTLGDRTAAEDVVQEALLDLALERTRKPVDVGVAAWLVRFAVCRARNWRSSERCRTRRQWVVGNRRPEETMPDDEAERIEEAERALSAADPDERTILAMRFLHGWDYDKIAAALETSEGAARVRVHRALANVRGRLGVGEAEEGGVARRLGAIAMVPLAAPRLDTAIRAAVEAAGPVPHTVVPRGGMPLALRAAILAFGVAAAVTLPAATSFLGADTPRDCSSAASDASTSLVAASDAGLRTGNGVADDAAGGWMRGARPEGWDGGALARLAHGEPDLLGTLGAPRPAGAPPVPGAPAAAEPSSAPPPQAPAVTEPPSALRLLPRIAGAANSESGSPYDERADALGGFSGMRAIDLTVERAASAPAEAPTSAPSDAEAYDDAARRRTSARARAAEPLDDEAKSLLAEATALVRAAVDEAVASAPSASEATVRDARRSGIRRVAHEVRQWRRGPADETRRTPPRKAAKLSRVYAILFDLAISEGRPADGVRWPDGVDVADALADLIRLLSTPADPAAARLPDVAVDAAAAVPDPSRLPDFE